MKKRLVALGAAAAVMALAVSIIAPAAADKRFEKRTLRLAEKVADDEQFETEIDVGDPGPSVGDYIVFEGEPVFNRALTREVGVFRGDCLFVQMVGEEEATIECDITFDLKQGLITVEGPITFAEPFEAVQEVAITGGTDDFETAHGELQLDFSQETGARFTFKLLL